MQKVPLDHRQPWARKVLEECSREEIRNVVSKYRIMAQDPVIDMFSHREFTMRADFLEDHLDSVIATTDHSPSGGQTGG